MLCFVIIIFFLHGCFNKSLFGKSEVLQIPTVHINIISLEKTIVLKKFHLAVNFRGNLIYWGGKKMSEAKFDKGKC